MNLADGSPSSGRTILTISTRSRDGSGSKSDSATIGQWLVDMMLDGECVRRGVVLTDPFDKYESNECRWYLETYLPQSPYEGSRAGEVRRQLDRYKSDLFEQIFDQGQVLKGKKGEILALTILIQESTTITTLAEASSIHKLHWEILEDPALWNGMEVECRRVIQTPRSQQPNTDEKDHKVTDKPLGTFTILLVVARILSATITQYQDTDPTTASRPLLALVDDIKTKISKVNFEVEIVRPGTFSAFEKHLKSKDPGYYDLVHFDLHGRVARRRGSVEEEVFLYFASQDHPEGLAPIPAERVCNILCGLVNSVVLNACETAKVGTSGNANLAQTLIQCGITTVLAMSFAITTSTVTHFLQCLYRYLRLDPGDLARASYKARRGLQTHHERNARFGLRIALQDYFVPVLYTSNSIVSCSGVIDGEVIDDRQSLKLRPSLNEIVGRNFDLLRFERHILDRGQAILAGTRGIGKTALLHQLSHTWTRTGFVRHCIYLDMGIGRLRTVENIVAAILEACQETDIDSSEELNLTQEQRKKKCISQLRRDRCALILDGLHDSLSDLHEDTFPLALHRPNWADILGFLDSLMLPASGEVDCPPYLIIVARDSEDSWWRERFDTTTIISHDVFTLTGLGQPDAMSLAGICLKRSVNCTTDSEKAEYNRLDIILRMCDYNPAAIKTILAGREDISEHFLKAFVAGTEPDSVFNSHRYKSEVVTSDLAKLTPTGANYVLSLYYFWLEGPFIGAWKHEFQDDPPEETSNIIDFVLNYLQDRGYIRHDGVSIDWISPLLTLYLRSRQEEICGCAPPDPEIQDQTVFTHSSFSKKAFMNAVSVRDILSRTISEVQGLDFAQESKRFRKSAGNILSCMMHCSDDKDRHLPTEDWPWLTWRFFSPFSRQILLPTEFSLFLDCYEAVINECFRRWGHYAVPSDYQVFVFAILNHLYASYKSELHDLNRSKEFVDRTVAVIKLSELEYGPIEDFEILYQKSLTFKYLAFHLLEVDKPEEAEKAWEMMQLVDELVYAPKLQEESQNEKSLPVLIQKAIDSLGKTEDERFEMRERLRWQRPYNDPVASGWRSLKTTMWSQMKASIAGIRSNEDFAGFRSIGELCQDAGPQLRNLRDAHEMKSMEGYTSDLRWWPKHFDMVSKFADLDDPLAQRKSLEDALNNADWRSVACAHIRLASLARRNGKIEEALTHTEAAIDIYQTGNDFVQELEDAHRNKHQLLAITRVTKGSQESDRNMIIGDHKAALKAFEEVEAGLENLSLNEESKTLLLEFKAHMQFMADMQETSSVDNNGKGAINIADIDRRVRNVNNDLADFVKREGLQTRLELSAQWNRATRTLIESSMAGNATLAWQSVKEMVAVKGRLGIRPGAPEDDELIYNLLLSAGDAALAQANEERRWTDALEIVIEYTELVHVHQSSIGNSSQLYERLEGLKKKVFHAMIEAGNERISKACGEGNWQKGIDEMKAMVETAEKARLQDLLEPGDSRRKIFFMERQRDLRQVDILRVRADREERYVDALQLGEQQIQTLKSWADRPDATESALQEISESRKFLVQEIQVMKINHHNREAIGAEHRKEYKEALQHLNELEKILVQQNDPKDEGYQGRLPVSAFNIVFGRIRINAKMVYQRVADEGRFSEET